jgi:hypothetical protein
MNERDPSQEPMQPDAALIMRQELYLQKDMINFKSTLDAEQQVDFEEIFGPVGQVELSEEADNTGERCVTRFGLFPAGKDLTSAQLSIYALIAAYKEEELASQLSDSPRLQMAHQAEAARLKQLARKRRDEKN